MTDGLLGEADLLRALGAALESASGCGAAVGVVVLRDAGTDGAARRLAYTARGLLPAGGAVGALGRDRVALVLPGYAGSAARGVADRIASTFEGVAAGWAAAVPDRSPVGPLDLVAEAEAAADVGRRTVLVVEDEPMVAGIIDAWLTATGDYEVLVAHSGREAIARCAERSPALVLMDLELPDMDGVELIGRLRERVRDLPAVACSGRRPESAAGAGFSGYFRKPLDMRALMGTVRRLLRTQPLGAAKENC